MQLKKSKKILLYFFLFVIVGSINNKNSNNINFLRVNKVLISGLDEKNNLILEKNINLLNIENLFFLKKNMIDEVINTNNLVENYFVFKKYPSTLDIKIEKTDFLARVKKNDTDFILGSNGRLIDITYLKYNLPFIFGDFEINNFFEFKKTIDDTNFDYNSNKNLFFFKSGRWDIETKEGIFIKLPKENLRKAMELFQIFLRHSDNQDIKIKKIDLRQYNQIIINEQ